MNRRDVLRSIPPALLAGGLPTPTPVETIGAESLARKVQMARTWHAELRRKIAECHAGRIQSDDALLAIPALSFDPVATSASLILRTYAVEASSVAWDPQPWREGTAEEMDHFRRLRNLAGSVNGAEFCGAAAGRLLMANFRSYRETSPDGRTGLRLVRRFVYRPAHPWNQVPHLDGVWREFRDASGKTIYPVADFAELP